MPVVTWQDGFEGAEVLSAVYGSVGVGTTIGVGVGRGGGNALQGSVGQVPITSAPHDPVIVGVALFESGGGAANITFSDAIGDFATLELDTLGRIAITLLGLGGAPILSAPTNPRIGGVWRYVEWYFSSKSVAGRVLVRVDNDLILDYTGPTGPAVRAPTLVGINGPTLDDFYVGVPANETDFFGDYRVSGTAPAAVGVVPAPANVDATQQFITYANVAPKQNATVDQQYIIVVIKNKGPAKVRPQVFGVGRS